MQNQKIRDQDAGIQYFNGRSIGRMGCMYNTSSTYLSEDTFLMVLTNRSRMRDGCVQAAFVVMERMHNWVRVGAAYTEVD